MFTAGLDLDTRAYFMSATLLIAIPTAIKLVNWVFAYWGSSYDAATHVYLVLAFLASFSIGGFTGISLSNAVLDTGLHDTYFVVGHFHYVLSLGAVYGVLISTCWFLLQLLGHC